MSHARNEGPGGCVPWEQHDRLVKENEELKRDGTPGVMHEVDQAFYDLAVKERDFARQRVARLSGLLDQAREAFRPFMDCKFRWEHGGQISPWLSREQWEAARDLLALLEDTKDGEG